MRIFIVIVAIAALPCCNRRSNLSNLSRVKTVYNSTLGGDLTYYYSKKGRLDSIINSDGSRSIYWYSNNTISSSVLNKIGAVIRSTVSYLNDRGLVDSSISRNESNTVIIKRRLYNSDGFPILEKNYINDELSDITQNTIVGNNIISFKVIEYIPDPNGSDYNSKTNKKNLFAHSKKSEYTVYLDYFPDKIKTLSNQNYGCPELGRGSDNAEKTMVQVSSSGDTTNITSFKYTFDSYSRVSSSILRSQSGTYDSTFVTYY